MKVEMQLTGLDGVLATLQSLPAEVVSKRGGPVRAALKKGANMILSAEKSNLRAAIASHPASSGHEEDAGLLLGSLIASRGKPPLDGKGERYLVRVKRKSYKRKGKTVTTLKTAQIFEYGSGKQPARPFIRPAFASNAANAIRTVEADLLKSVDKIADKLLSQNGAK